MYVAKGGQPTATLDPRDNVEEIDLGVVLNNETLQNVNLIQFLTIICPDVETRLQGLERPPLIKDTYPEGRKGRGHYVGWLVEGVWSQNILAQWIHEITGGACILLPLEEIRRRRDPPVSRIINIARDVRCNRFARGFWIHDDEIPAILNHNLYTVYGCKGRAEFVRTFYHVSEETCKGGGESTTLNPDTWKSDWTPPWQNGSTKTWEGP